MTSVLEFRLIAPLLCGLLGAAAVSTAHAQSSLGARGLLDDAWVFNVGAFVFGSSLKARLNGASIQNPDIDFDHTFGAARDSTRVRADVRWRITPTHRMRFMYFNNSISRTSTLAEDLQWGDYTFGSGTSATFRNEFKALAVAYEYAFIRKPDYEIAASAGVHYMDIKLQLSGTATITDGQGNTSQASAASKVSSLPAPLPMIGLLGGWVVAPDWYIDAGAQFFKVNTGDYDGHWSDLRVGATWMFRRHYGIGVGFNRFTTRVDVSRNDFDGRLKLGYNGAQAYLTGSF